MAILKQLADLPINRGIFTDLTPKLEQARVCRRDLTLFPEGKQAYNPGGMNVDTEAHLLEMFCPSLLN